MSRIEPKRPQRPALDRVDGRVHLPGRADEDFVELLVVLLVALTGPGREAEELRLRLDQHDGISVEQHAVAHGRLLPFFPRQGASEFGRLDVAPQQGGRAERPNQETVDVVAEDLAYVRHELVSLGLRPARCIEEAVIEPVRQRLQEEVP